MYNWDEDEAELFINRFAKATGISKKQRYKVMRYLVTGIDKGPDIKKLIQIIGPEETIRRINQSLTS